ncbi:hypothetical protein CC78DRAFT_586769 [Lojkania enalia]|uniref:Uncharacterized protein n=1 Tax=Lojkania enalia TaxID=147567 RepID=A0A9P4JY57_9PLEO|nr:hypothetical protein CC78DRAFT_586769 [Didymosphaeria enalia]
MASPYCVASGRSDSLGCRRASKISLKTLRGPAGVRDGSSVFPPSLFQYPACSCLPVPATTSAHQALHIILSQSLIPAFAVPPARTPSPPPPSALAPRSLLDSRIICFLLDCGAPAISRFGQFARTLKVPSAVERVPGPTLHDHFGQERPLPPLGLDLSASFCAVSLSHYSSSPAAIPSSISRLHHGAAKGKEFRSLTLCAVAPSRATSCL